MKITNLGSNKTVLDLGDKKVYFSYNTPIVASIDGELYATNKKYSVTTSKHMTQFLNGQSPVFVNQDFIDNLLKQ